jgi:hypothetical protein
MMKKTVNILSIAVFVLLMMVFRPICVRKDNCLWVEGTITTLREGGVKDVVIFLRDVPERFYINRGLENGLELEALQYRLKGKHVRLGYIDHWTPLDPKGENRHVAELQFDGEVVYTEFK